MRKAVDQKMEAEKRQDSLRREIDLLNQDKTFLSRENVGLEERVKRLQDKLDRVEEELSEAKRQASRYMDRVLAANDEVKGKFETQYEKEMTEMKERHQREMEMAKNNLVEIYEKRVEYLRERKDELER